VVINRVIVDSSRLGSISPNEAKDEGVTTSERPNEIENISTAKRIDIKEGVALAATIASFLLVLTFIGDSNHLDSLAQLTVVLLSILSVGSLVMFINIERKAVSPLIELRLMTHKVLLPANIIILIFGITMFMVYQTIPILVRSCLFLTGTTMKPEIIYRTDCYGTM
jgi:hypothetical protein